MNNFTRDDMPPSDKIRFEQWCATLDHDLGVRGEFGTWRNASREVRASSFGADDIRLEFNPVDREAGGEARRIVARFYRCTVEGAKQAARDVQRFLETDTMPKND